MAIRNIPSPDIPNVTKTMEYGTGLQSVTDGVADVPKTLADRLEDDAANLRTALGTAPTSHSHASTPGDLGTGSSITTKFLRGDGTWQTLSGGGDAVVASSLDQFADVTQASGKTLALSESLTVQTAAVTLTGTSGGSALTIGTTASVSGSNTGDNATNTSAAAATSFIAGAGALTGPASPLTIGTMAAAATGDYATSAKFVAGAGALTGPASPLTIGTIASAASGDYATSAKFVAGAGALTGPAAPLTIGTAAGAATGDFAAASHSLDSHSDVVIATPVVDQVLKFNGAEWVNGAETSASASNGVDFFPDDTAIIAVSANNAFPLRTLSKTPIVGSEDVDSIVVSNTTAMYGAYLYDSALGKTSIDAGVWNFDIYCGVSSANGVTSLSVNIMRVRPETGTIDITTEVGDTTTSRTATASTGVPFDTAKIDASASLAAASYLRTPAGWFQITSRVSDKVVKIATLAGYTNESTVAFSVYKKLFSVTTGEINTVASTYAAMQLVTINSVQPAFTIEATDKLASLWYGTSDASPRTVYFSHNGASKYSHFHTPLSTLHNDMAGVQGGTTGEAYHMTAAQHTAATAAQAAGTASIRAIGTTATEAAAGNHAHGNIAAGGTIGTALLPTANDGAALGSTTYQFSDLFLAEGGVINFDNGDLTLTQSGNTLTLAGGDLALGANNLTMTGSIADTTNRVLKGWFTDLQCTNAIAGSVTGNAATVTGATFTTALTVNTGTVTLTGNAANNSVLTIGAGAVSVSGANTGDNAANSSCMANTVANANSLLYAVTDDTPAALALAANEFAARSSSGNIVAKSITDAALSVLDDATVAAMRATLAIPRTLVFDFDGGGAAISADTIAMIRLPFGFSANSWSLVGSANARTGAAAACAITLMVYVGDWSTSAFPSTDVVGGGTDPALSAATGATAATNWDDEAWASGQLVMVKPSGTPTAKWATLIIEGTET